MDLARAPCRAPLTARKMGSGYENASEWLIARLICQSLTPLLDNRGGGGGVTSYLVFKSPTYYLE